MQATGLKGNWEAQGGWGAFPGFIAQRLPRFTGRQSVGLMVWTNMDCGKEQDKLVVSQSTGVTRPRTSSHNPISIMVYHG